MMPSAHKLTLISFLALMAVFFITPAQARGRPHVKAFKGMELYSWKDSSGDWIFALLPGTNRLKTVAEIEEKSNRIPGAKELGKRFLRLAVGEDVFWSHADIKNVAYPDGKMMAAIASSARKAKIKLHLP